MVFLRIVFSVVLSGLLTSCGGGTAPVSLGNTIPKGVRILGLDIANTTQNNDFNSNITLAKAAGVEAVTLHLNWSTVEPTAPVNGVPVYDANLLDLLSVANTIYSANNLRLSLTIAPIDTDGFKVPPDLVNQAFYNFTNDPLGVCTGTQNLLGRFNQMVSAVLARFPNVTLTSLQIGNEIDIELLKSHAVPLDTLWNQYAVFAKCAREHARTQRPGLNIGMTFTYAGLTGAAGASFKEYNRIAMMDVIGVTYYPLNADFTVKTPSPVANDFNALVSMYHTQQPVLAKPFFWQEAGLPTSVVNNSSETLQAQFIRDVFSAWDNHATEIPYLAFLRLNDLGTPVSATDKFSEYLRTLGLRTYSGTGTNKPGYCALKSEARSRGWSADNSVCP